MTSALACLIHQFLYRTMCLIDREMRVGVPGGVGIGDSDAAVSLPRAFEDVVIVVIRVEQRVRDITVAVWPAIDGDRGDVARTGKAAGPEHAIELVADACLEIRKRRGEEAGLADTELGARIEPTVGCTGNMDQMQTNGLGGIARMAVPA